MIKIRIHESLGYKTPYEIYYKYKYIFLNEAYTQLELNLASVTFIRDISMDTLNKYDEGIIF